MVWSIQSYYESFIKIQLVMAFWFSLLRFGLVWYGMVWSSLIQHTVPSIMNCLLLHSKTQQFIMLGTVRLKLL